MEGLGLSGNIFFSTAFFNLRQDCIENPSVMEKNLRMQNLASPKYLLSCDWGTSSFRLRLVDFNSLKILAESTTEKGIAAINELWKQKKNADPRERINFFLNVIEEQIRHLTIDCSTLRGIPLLVSGMASSTLGIKNLPYGEIPFQTNGKGINTHWLEKSKRLNHPVLLISGIRSENDVMRGEETQLIGIMNILNNRKGRKIFIFPGTHSKHIYVKNEQVTSFRTFMTGEFYRLLSAKSILSESVEENKDFGEKRNIGSFIQGVEQAIDSNLLNSSFWVRTNELFGELTTKENLFFLSGLIIGTELKELRQQDFGEIYLCSGSNLKTSYETALLALGIKEVQVLPARQLDEAVIMGQYQVFRQFLETGFSRSN